MTKKCGELDCLCLVVHEEDEGMCCDCFDGYVLCEDAQDTCCEGCPDGHY